MGKKSNVKGIGTDDDLKVLGFLGEEWGEAEDQYCARKGIQTSEQHPAALSPTQQSEAERRASASDHQQQGCSVTFMDPLDGGDCRLARERVFKCNLRNSATFKQCEAYALTAFSKKYQRFQLSMNLATAAMCGVACAVSGVPYAQGLENACGAVAMADGAAEIASSLLIKQSTFSRGVSMIGGAGGLAAGGLTLSEVGDKGSGNKNSNRNASCTTAAVFAGLAVVRGGALRQMNKTRKEACTMVKATFNHEYDRAIAGGDDSPDGRAPGGFLLGGGGGNRTNGGRGSSPDSPTRAVDYEKALDDGVRRFGAMDANLLHNSGLGRNFKNRFDQVGPSIADAFDRGGIEAAMVAALPGGAPAGLASALTGAGELFAQDANSGIDRMPQGGVGGLYAGGSASRAPATGGGPSNPFAAFGAGARNSGLGGASTSGAVQFAGEAESTDIWHRGTDLNLFQIVSGRIERVQRRAAMR
jgi:hypothetical protein